MGGTLPKLISRCLHRLLQPTFDTFFHPYQFGVGMQRGSETIFKRIEDVQNHYPERVILKIDFTNAFNTIDRTVVLEEVSRHFPSLLPWVQARYDSPTILWAKKSATEPCCEILSQQGTQQGDPLAGFLFAIAAHILLKSVNASMAETPSVNGSVIAYLDDFVLEGSPEAVGRAWDLVVTDAPKLGMHVNLSKCEIYSAKPLPEEDDYFPEEIKSSTTSIELLGGMIGHEDEVALFLEKKINAIAEEAGRLSKCNNPQYHMLLIRYCVCQKFTYLMRLMNPHYTLPDGTAFAKKVDKLLRGCLSSLLLYEPHQTLTNEAWTQATLPFAHGGLGLLDAPNTHAAAFVAASVECSTQLISLHELSTRAAETQEPHKVPDAEHHYKELVAQTEPFTGTEGHEYRLPKFEDLGDEQSHLQLGITRVIQACRAHKLIANAPQSFKARMIFCADTGSAMFQAIPKYTTPELAFPPDGTAYLAAVCTQLGLPIGFIVAQECVGCTVGERFVNRDGYHLLSQCKKNRTRFLVHDALRDNLAALIRFAGYHCNIERSDILRSIDDTTNQRTDITVYGWTATGTLEIDVSVTDYRQLLEGGARTTTIHPYESSHRREQHKVRRTQIS